MVSSKPQSVAKSLGEKCRLERNDAWQSIDPLSGSVALARGANLFETLGPSEEDPAAAAPGASRHAWLSTSCPSSRFRRRVLRRRSEREQRLCYYRSGFSLRFLRGAAGIGGAAGSAP